MNQPGGVWSRPKLSIRMLGVVVWIVGWEHQSKTKEHTSLVRHGWQYHWLVWKWWMCLAQELAWWRQWHGDMGQMNIQLPQGNTMNRYESTFLFNDQNIWWTKYQHISTLFKIDHLDFLTFHPCILVAILDHMAGETTVKRPKVGDEVPSEVRAEVRWSLTGMLPLGP